MPAAVRVAPEPGAGSTTATASPRWAQRHATASPITPPPTTSTSYGSLTSHLPVRRARALRRGPCRDSFSDCSLRRHYPDQVLRSAAPSCPLSPVNWAPVLV